MILTLHPYQQEAVEALEGEFVPAPDSADSTATVADPVEMEFE